MTQNKAPNHNIKFIFISNLGVVTNQKVFKGISPIEIMKYESQLDSILADAREIRERVSGSDAREEFVKHFAENIVENVKTLEHSYNSFSKMEKFYAFFKLDYLARSNYGYTKSGLRTLDENLRKLWISIYAREEVIENIQGKRVQRKKGIGDAFRDHYLKNDVDDPENSLPLIEGRSFIEEYEQVHALCKDERNVTNHECPRPLLKRSGLEYLTTSYTNNPELLARKALDEPIERYLNFAVRAIRAITHQEDSANLMARTSTDKKRNARHYWWNGQKRSLFDAAKTFGVATAMCTAAGIGLFSWASYAGWQNAEKNLDEQRKTVELTKIEKDLAQMGLALSKSGEELSEARFQASLLESAFYQERANELREKYLAISNGTYDLLSDKEVSDLLDEVMGKNTSSP